MHNGRNRTDKTSVNKVGSTAKNLLMLHVGEPSLLPRPKEPSSGRTDKRSSSQNPWRPTCMHGGGYKIQYVQTSMGQFLPSSSFHFFLPLFQIITTSFSSPPFFLRPAFLLSFIFSSLSPTPNFPPSPSQSLYTLFQLLYITLLYTSPFCSFFLPLASILFHHSTFLF